MLLKCGRQDSNPYGLSRYPLSSRGSLATGSQSQRVCRFHHARVRGIGVVGCNVAGGVRASLGARYSLTPPLPHDSGHCSGLSASRSLSYGFKSVWHLGSGFPFPTSLDSQVTHARGKVTKNVTVTKSVTSDVTKIVTMELMLHRDHGDCG